MATQRPEAPCPVCDGAVSGWASVCPRCGYHPDRYNRALDDVALIFRLSSYASLQGSPGASAQGAPPAHSRVRSFLQRMVGRAPAAAAGPLEQISPPPESSPGAGVMHS